MKRTLKIRKEVFSDLATDELTAVAGGTTTVVPIYLGPSDPDVCINNSVAICLTGNCFSDAANCTQYCYPTRRPTIC